MLRVKVRSLVDTHLNTGVHEYNISAGQVFTCDLKCQEHLDEFVRMAIFEVVDPAEPEVKPLQVFYPDPSPVEAVLLSEAGEPLPLSSSGSVLEQDV